MSEFIVWDKDNYFGEDNQFHELERFLYEGLSVHFEKDNGLVIIDYDVYDYASPKPLNIETFNYIGKADINNKKIYADCSIVEFEYFDDNPKNTCKMYGYFSFKEKELGFRVCTFNNSYFSNFNHIRDFKIIDTIQENKLGLSK